jgi:hypothetical protein
MIYGWVGRVYLDCLYLLDIVGEPAPTDIVMHNYRQFCFWTGQKPGFYVNISGRNAQFF